MLAVDTETTGTNVENDRIVSVALAWVGGGEPTAARSMIVNPGVEIPKAAADIHGITTERARAEGVDPQTAITAVLDDLTTAARYGYPIVGMNLRFDLTILDRESRRYSIAPFVDEILNLLAVDVYVLDKHLDRYRKGSRKLEVLAEHYRATLDGGAHNAETDAIAAARVAWRIAKTGQIVRKARTPEEEADRAILVDEWFNVRDDLPALHAAQERWAAEQARGLAEYFAAKGEPQTVAEEWPVIPFRP